MNWLVVDGLGIVFDWGLLRSNTVTAEAGSGRAQSRLLHSENQEALGRRSGRKNLKGEDLNLAEVAGLDTDEDVFP